jgi:hypothetical protein
VQKTCYDKCIQILSANLIGRIPLRISRHMWKDNIKVVLGETGCKGVEWILLAQGRVQ